MRIDKKKSTSGMQSLQLDGADCERRKGTYANTKQGFRKIKYISVKPL